MRLLLLLHQQVCTPGPKSQLVQMLKQQPGSLTPSFFGGCWCNNLHGCCKINLCACLQPRPQVFPDPHLVVLLLQQHPARMQQQQPRSTSPTPNLLCGCWSSNLYYLHPPLSCATSAGDPEPDPQLALRLLLCASRRSSVGPASSARHARASVPRCDVRAFLWRAALPCLGLRHAQNHGACCTHGPRLGFHSLVCDCLRQLPVPVAVSSAVGCYLLATLTHGLIPFNRHDTDIQPTHGRFSLTF